MRSVSSPAGAPAGRRTGIRARAVLFDLDGTLVDTAPDIAIAVNRMREEMGRRAYPEHRILEWIGEGAARLVQRALAGDAGGSPPSGDVEDGLELFRRHYAAGICVLSKPYPHVRRVLETLRASGVGTACVTNKPEALTRLLLDELSLTPAFDVIVGGDTLEFRKPRPEPVQHACRRLNLAPEDAVFVGDSMTDCRAAAAAGVPMVAVTYGYHRGADLTRASCAAMIDSLEALPEILERD